MFAHLLAVPSRSDGPHALTPAWWGPSLKKNAQFVWGNDGWAIPSQPPDKEAGQLVAPMVAPRVPGLSFSCCHTSLGACGSHTRWDEAPEPSARGLHRLNGPSSHWSTAYVLEMCWVPAELDRPQPVCSVRTTSHRMARCTGDVSRAPKEPAHRQLRARRLPRAPREAEDLGRTPWHFRGPGDSQGPFPNKHCWSGAMGTAEPRYQGCYVHAEPKEP